MILRINILYCNNLNFEQLIYRTFLSGFLPDVSMSQIIHKVKAQIKLAV